MATEKTKRWLVAYDIACPVRLRRVHKYLRSEGLAVQYSVFILYANDREIRLVLDDLALLISASHDDLRAYHIPKHCAAWLFGRQAGAQDLGLHIEGQSFFL